MEFSALIPQTSFRGETTACVTKCWLFSQAIEYVDLTGFLIMCRVVILCDDNGIGTDSNSYTEFFFFVKNKYF